MGNYIITNQGGRCSVTDTENGVTIDWLVGDFVNTADTEVDPDGGLFNLSEQDRPDALARVRRDIYEHVTFTRPELL